MAGSYIVNVPKLKGRENYDEWAFAAENFLLLDGVDINEESAGDVASVDLKKAKAKLIMTIDSSLFVHIKNEKTVKEVWNRLKTLFDDSGFTRRIGLLRQLISIRLEDSDSMTAYVTQMVDTAQKLKGTGFEITDEWVGSLLLAGLSEKFAPMIMAIEHSGMKISTDAIKAKLLDMESSTVGSTDGAFLSKSWQQRNKKRDNNVNMSKSQTSNQKTTTKVVRCYRCKQPGHYMNKCPQNSREKTENAFSAIFLNPQNQFRVSDWYVDSGASSHMVVDKNCLEKVIPSHEVKNIVVANRETIPVLCAGNTRITTVIDDSEFDIPVKNVLCIPNLTTNLLSVSQLIQNGNSVSFEEDVCYIRNRQNALVGKAELVNGVYRLCIKSPTLFVASAAVATSEMWHRRLGHINSQDLNTMKNGVVEGISYPDRAVIDKSKCITCCEGKQARLPFTHKGTRSEAVLELVHADVCGPMEQVSIGSSRYFLLFVDDFSRMAFVYFLKAKSEVYKYFKEFKAFVERQTGRKLKVLRTDNGGEFCSLEMKCFLQKAGIAHQKTNPYTPEQNGMCERMNRTVVERARCLLFDANMPKKFWAEAVNTAVYLRNRTIASGLTKTPYELWTGRKPDVSHVRVFGSTAMTHVPKMKTAKWDKKAEKLILVGYDNNVKGYRLFDPKSNKIITSRDVIIMEHAQSTNDMTQAVVEEKSDNFEETEPTIDSSDLTCTSPEGDTTLDVTYVPDDTGSSSSADEFFNTLSDTNQLNVRNITSEKRQRRAPERFGFMCVGEENLTYADVMSGPEQKEWCSAMKDEMRSFSECDAWEIVEKPDNCTIVKCKWVYKKKLDSDNKVRYRARLVAKGFTQKEGIDFKETFSPVLRYSVLKLLFALSVKLDMKVTHYDVTTAFLNGNLEETVYMQPPPNLSLKGKVLKLKRAIYGLKQSARAWYMKVDECLQKLNYKKSQHEPCLFVSETKKTYIALFVDDFFVFSTCAIEVGNFKCELCTRFKLKDLGQVRKCLGMRVEFCNNKLRLDQEEFINSLLIKFGLENCNETVTTPMEINLKLDKSESCNEKYPYQQLIGSLMYLSILTRPDISFSISFLSQFNNCFNKVHWQHAKRVLKYLKTTKSYCLTYTKDDLDIVGYVDADWASNAVDRRSYTGFCFKLSGAVISHECRKQQTVALSSTEAEYMGVCEASKEAIFLKNVMLFLTGKEVGPIVLYNDNQSAKKLTENCMFYKRSKHIDVRFHFIREAVANNLVKIVYLPTTCMPADILTKSLPSVKHYKFLLDLGLYT